MTSTQDLATSTRREMTLLVIIFFALVVVGVLFYKHVENLNWIDAIYFTCITITTLGYGDITPQTDIAKLFTAFYGFLGVGMFLGVTGLLFQEAILRSRAHRFRIGKRK